MPLAETVVRSRAAASHSPGLEDRFHQLPHVVSARAGDATVLMDQKRGRYFTLNEVGGRVWELVGDGVTLSQVVERLLQEYDVSRPQLEYDASSTLQQLIGDRLIAAGPPSPLAHALERAAAPMTQALPNTGEVKVPSVFKCGLMLFAMKVLLKTRGFGWTISWVKRRVGVPSVRDDVNVETVKVIEYRVAMAGALYPGRALCLEQSLALYCLLRWIGLGADIRFGVQPYPFSAHAWVEYDGAPINDFAEHVSHFIKVPALHE